jgi:hypothetical protein
MKAESHNDAHEPQRTSLPGVGGEKPAAWELIDVGRYRPRRIRGSCLGRELG